MTAQEIEAKLSQLIEEDMLGENLMSVDWVTNLGSLSQDHGVTIGCKDGSEFHLSIVQEKAANN